ncbi:uncharacterized protein LOC123890054 [Trifolium pratense]|uniref:uncharacterized protein LOC123890054 n=1 Tax=Trifolium pratense TaxID=57577 RepID=UPI001E694318|nr:uncharacterized protein LOC123890054 [Trifolium pratense]
MEEMSRNLVPPKNIMSTLKDRDPNNKTTAKQLYNLSHRLKLKMRASMTEMQHLSKRLVETGYFFKHRTVVADGSEHVQDIFFAHPKSISLFNSFPTVLLMDSTYKTNKYKMPLFEIVGFTSTGRSFNVGFAWLTNEREDNFTWALEQCVSLLRNEDVRPKVIVTDRDLALMNAVSEVFPTSAAMLFDTERYKYVTDALFPPPRRSKHAIATKDKWFTFPDMGYVVATHFQRVVVQLSNMEKCGASRTCFPLRGKPPSDTSDLDSKIICIGALADHFVLVRLKVGCLIPPTAHQWKNSCSEEAADWEPMFLDRMQKFGELLTIERAGDDLVTIGKGSKDDPLEL